MKYLPFLIVLTTLLTACGQKGALVRPERPAPAVPPSSMAMRTP